MIFELLFCIRLISAILDYGIDLHQASTHGFPVFVTSMYCPLNPLT